MFFACLSCASCAVQAKDVRPNVSNFSQVSIKAELKLKICEEGKECELKSQGIAGSLGSGTFFRYKNKRAFLTAGHVCLGPTYTIWESIPPESQVSIQIRLVSFSGKKMDAKIYYVNLKYDFCILEVPNNEYKNLPSISPFKPKQHSNVYSIQAPFSIFHTGMVPVMDGRYLGDHKIFSFFAMPAGPGGSGGPIYNKKNQIIGIVQRTHLAFDHVTLSIKYNDLIRLLDRYIELKEQKIEQLIE